MDLRSRIDAMPGRTTRFPARGGTATMTWDPGQYLKFGGERMRPALDLLARVALDAPGTIVDLGCGPGNATALLKRRWPHAKIRGIDNSAAMLEQARARLPDVTWEQTDLARWTPPSRVDLIFSNAALHWLDDHATLFPALAEQLEPGGVLAVQMPAQHRAPSHLIGYDLAETGPWRGHLASRVRRRPVLEPDDYHAMLAGRVSSLDLWTTEYLQVLRGADPVVEFTKGSFVGVWLSALPPADALAFESEYRRRIAAAYPRRADGTTLFPFRRFFLIARR
jgi:trans-aconitate 2-methyltransferase